MTAVGTGDLQYSLDLLSVTKLYKSLKLDFVEMYSSLSIFPGPRDRS